MPFCHRIRRSGRGEGHYFSLARAFSIEFLIHIVFMVLYVQGAWFGE